MIEREDIIRWARKAGLITSYGGRETAADELLERFAALVAAHEREECAELVENFATYKDDEWVCGKAAEAIRARSLS